MQRFQSRSLISKPKLSLSACTKVYVKLPSSVSIFLDFLGCCCVKMTFCWEQKRRITPSAVYSKMKLFEKQLSLKRVICLFIYALLPLFQLWALESALWSPRRDHWGRYHYLISQEFTLKLQLHCDEKRIGGKWLNPNQSVDSIFFCYTEKLNIIIYRAQKWCAVKTWLKTVVIFYKRNDGKHEPMWIKECASKFSFLWKLYTLLCGLKPSKYWLAILCFQSSHH